MTSCGGICARLCIQIFELRLTKRLKPFINLSLLVYISELKYDCTYRAPSATFIIFSPFTMSTAPSPEISINTLKDNVEKDDPLWKEYVDKAAVFDVRTVDEWNRIVDVLLVYVNYYLLPQRQNIR